MMCSTTICRRSRRLIEVKRDGQTIPAVAQPTKTGFLWVLNRVTGEPLFPVVERPVAQSDVPGEVSSSTQPEPLLPPPLALQQVTDADIWGLTPIDRAACAQRIHALRNEGLFTPPSLRGSLVVPYFGGGSNWGGMGYDPASHLAILNVMNVPGYVRLFPSAEYKALKSKGGDEVGPMIGAPFGMQRGLVLSPLGVPCTRPPWGTISAVDLDTGEIRWQHPFGAISVRGPRPDHPRGLGRAEPGRASDHGRRPRIHRRDAGRLHPRAGYQHWRCRLATRPALSWRRDADGFRGRTGGSSSSSRPAAASSSNPPSATPWSRSR